MDGLTSVTIPNNVTSIMYAAFYNCSGLTSVTIPTNVTSIANSAFGNCSGLTTVNFNATNCQTMGYMSGNTISNVFYNCPNFTTLNIASNVQRIPDYAFAFSSSLSGTLNIPNAVSYIGDYAFYGCSGLTSVSLGGSVNTIGLGAFRNSIGLTSITIPNSVNTLKESAFRGCTALGSVVIGNGVSQILAKTFYGCTHLTNIAMGSGIQSIATDAFGECTAVLRMRIRATTPPSSPNNPFTSFNASIPVSVPCNSVNAYRNAPYWGFFSNISGENHAFSATSADLTKGSVQVIQAPDCDNLQAEVQANAYNGYHFVRWSDNNTDTHRFLVVTHDTAIIAYFAAENHEDIDGVETLNAKLYSKEGRIVVEGADGNTVTLYDVTGCMLATRQDEYSPLYFDVPASGAYLVKIGNHPARKVVVIR